MRQEKEFEKLRKITESTIEDVVGKMCGLGKSFSDIAQYLILTEAEVEEAFIRYQHRFESSDRP
ncbi:hypothetical protein NG796_11970 [Laspinema sp. A4]|uniref:hypothetical protein n=1 Tax=Laspinema sp. D2d TaxID=2953686 RepID=UPI0021BAB3B6|nr:hypothetical protein [Laspinema sp. D2d]MCT7984016.1 hypothetical protein [Laspinema sp. D2d]